MQALDVLLIAGGLVALAAFIFLWRRFPKRRKHLVIAAVLGTGVAAFAAWWVIFRTDDPTFDADRAHAEDAQKQLDDALGQDF